MLTQIYNRAKRRDATSRLKEFVLWACFSAKTAIREDDRVPMRPHVAEEFQGIISFPLNMQVFSLLDAPLSELSCTTREDLWWRSLSILRIIQMLIDERICKTSPYTHSILDNQSVKAHVLPLNFKECICNWSIRCPSSMTLNLFYYPASCKRTTKSLWHDQQDKNFPKKARRWRDPLLLNVLPPIRKPWNDRF